MVDEPEEKYITVCSCGNIVYNGEIVGKLNIHPNGLMDSEGEITLVYVDDSCTQVGKEWKQPEI